MQTFFLMSGDKTLIEFATDGFTYKIVQIHEEYKKIFPMAFQSTLSSEILVSWLNSRISPRGKKLVKKILPDTRSQGPLGHLGFTLGLSLNDVFWVDDGSHTWKEVNLYENELNAEIAQLAFDQGIEPHAIVGSRSPEFTSGGSQRKCWLKRDGKIFLMKGDEPDADGICQTTREWFAAQVAEAMRIPHVFYDLRYRHENMLEPVCECASFTDLNKGFVSALTFFAAHGVNPALVQLSGSTRKFHERLAAIYGQTDYEDMMLFDAVVGNSDRHLLNFGKIYANATGEILGTAPIFDHGLSFARDENCCFFSREEQLNFFLRPRHEEMLLAARDLELKQHPLVTVSAEALESMQSYLKTCMERALKNLSAHSFSLGGLDTDQLREEHSQEI